MQKIGELVLSTELNHETYTLSAYAPKLQKSEALAVGRGIFNVACKTADRQSLTQIIIIYSNLQRILSLLLN